MTDQLNSLLNEFTSELEDRDHKIKDWIQNLSADELKLVKDRVSPYNLTIPTDKKERSVSFSYTPMRQQYEHQLTVTSMIGFLFRMVNEWCVPDGVKPVDLDEWVRNPKVADVPDHVKDERSRVAHERNRDTMRDRLAVRNFLLDMFQFDPDKHAVSAYIGNKADPTRRLPATDAARLAVKTGNTVRKMATKPFNPRVEDLTYKPKTETEQLAMNIIPPLDLFARYERYLHEHYEEYLHVVNDLYANKPDIDLALNVYEVHNDKKAAEEFKDKYADQVIAPITNVRTNHWVILGPYRQNRERVDFFNRHTQVLKAMLQKREEDSHIATDIMRKRAKIKKAENVKTDGPDDPEFLKYIGQNKPEIEAIGGERFGADVKDQKEVELVERKVPAPAAPAPDAPKAYLVKPPAEKKEEKKESVRKEQALSEQDDCPKDMVQVEVFKFDDGGAKLNVEKIYNPVEAPLIKS